MKRGTLIAVIAGGLVLVLLWYFVLFSPTSSDLNDTRDEVAAMESQNEELQNTIRRLKELSENATQQAASLRTLRAAIPPNPDLGEFILQANEIATAAGIDWLSIAPSPPTASEDGGSNSTIAVTIQVDGGFFQVLDYLNRFEDLERLVLIDSINVTAAGASTNGEGGDSDSESGDVSSTGGAPDLSVTLTGRMFTTAEAAAADGSTPTTPGSTTSTTPSGATSSSSTPPASSSGSSS